jgi:hypothetical protein
LLQIDDTELTNVHDPSARQARTDTKAGRSAALANFGRKRAS